MAQLATGSSGFCALVLALSACASESLQPGTPRDVTGKAIAPLAPGASPARFTDPAKVEKSFTRNCNDVLKRTCTPAEKGDVLAYLMSLK